MTEENVDNEMLKENALCKPCDRIIYLHFRKMWMDQRQIKSEMNDSSVPEPRLPSPEDEVDTSFFSNYALGMDALNMTDSIKLLLNVSLVTGGKVITIAPESASRGAVLPQTGS